MQVPFTQGSRCSLPSSVLGPFCKRRAFIYFLEAFAQIVTGILFEDLLGQYHTTFCDNEAAKHAIIKGYGSDTAVNNLIGTYWTNAANSCLCPWVERVSSKANLSDGVSRDDWALQIQHRWHRIDIDLEPIFPILLRAADDEQFAHSSAAAEMKTAMRPQISRALQSCPWLQDIVFETTREFDFDKLPKVRATYNEGRLQSESAFTGHRGAIDTQSLLR